MRWNYNLTDILRRLGFPQDHDLNYCRALRRDRAATFPDGREADRHPDDNGGYSMTLPPAMLDPIKEPARPGRELQRRDLRLATEK
jgi:hypothetical protein